jgi:amino acid transporter
MTDEGVATPKPILSVLNVVGIIVGIVIGVGIFRTPALIAAHVKSEIDFLLIWAGGGLISLLGALCYAELATAYPHPGGEYHYLGRAFGQTLAWLFAWARLVVIQTGSIALLAFVVGDYLAQLLSLGSLSASVYAGLSIIALTTLNVIGIQAGNWTQQVLTAAKLLGLVSVCWAGLASAVTITPSVATDLSPSGHYGLAMIFVLLTYGGWNEAAYLSAELRDVPRNMTKSLVGSIGLITVVFMLTNLAYLKGLGLAGIAQSNAVATELMRHTVGEGGAQLISVLIVITALGSMNGTIMTGARTNYALGQDFRLLSYLGRWHPHRQTPINALLVQGGIALILVFLGTLTQTGFATIVDYTAPVFWLFMVLITLSLFILRQKQPEVPRPFSVPLYPFTPLLFCLVCLYMLQASLRYTGVGALVGVAVLLAGVPILWVAYWFESPTTPRETG